MKDKMDNISGKEEEVPKEYIVLRKVAENLDLILDNRRLDDDDARFIPVTKLMLNDDYYVVVMRLGSSGKPVVAHVYLDTDDDIIIDLKDFDAKMRLSKVRAIKELEKVGVKQI
jgi:hypothetical protein